MVDQAISSDYEYGDEWDWDRSDPRQYCHHGRFIGSWWGPDIMCFDCEMGHDPTLNEMIESFDKQIEKFDNYIACMKDIILHTINIITKDNNGYMFLSDMNDFFDEKLKSYKASIKSLIKQKQETYEKYIQFCDDEENDRDVLYKFHRKEIENWTRNGE